ncbi:hypothetical protein ACNHKD_07210 [Methylocystis sp. JAN1]|uniref:hypothetical protein n=1 Tax=Methylocystis sp. JAN1 TaxID=3397211 RepID=UPI003FA269E1
MTSIPRLFAALGVALIAAGAAQAVESVEMAASDSARFQRRHQAPAQEEARNADNAMQAMCREILVDTDEGYGVTNRESRVICDELR